MKLSGVYGASDPTKRISRNFEDSDLSSGQFFDKTIIKQCEDVEMLFIPNVRGIMLIISGLPYARPLFMTYM